MFLELAHTKIEAYSVTRSLAVECYKLTNTFPADERFGLTQQVRRAAVSIHLNLAEGCSRKSEAERKRYFEIARGSLIEIDAALDVASDLGYCKKESLEQLGIHMVNCFKNLSALIKSITH